MQNVIWWFLFKVKYQLFSLKTVNIWSTKKGHGLRTVATFQCVSLSFLLFPSCPILSFLALCIMSSNPYGPATHLSSAARSCLVQTRAKRLILALRSSKLSQLFSFPPLSVSVSSRNSPRLSLWTPERRVVLLTSLGEKLVSSLCLNHCFKTLGLANTYTHAVEAHPHREGLHLFIFI